MASRRGRYPQLERDVDAETERAEREAIGWYDNPQAGHTDDAPLGPQHELERCPDWLQRSRWYRPVHYSTPPLQCG